MDGPRRCHDCRACAGVAVRVDSAFAHVGLTMNKRLRNVVAFNVIVAAIFWASGIDPERGFLAACGMAALIYFNAMVWSLSE